MNYPDDTTIHCSSGTYSGAAINRMEKRFGAFVRGEAGHPRTLEETDQQWHLRILLDAAEHACLEYELGHDTAELEMPMRYLLALVERIRSSP